MLWENCFKAHQGRQDAILFGFRFSFPDKLAKTSPWKGSTSVLLDPQLSHPQALSGINANPEHRHTAGVCAQSGPFISCSHMTALPLTPQTWWWGFADDTIVGALISASNEIHFREETKVILTNFLYSNNREPPLSVCDRVLWRLDCTRQEGLVQGGKPQRELGGIVFIVLLPYFCFLELYYVHNQELKK